MNNQNMMMRTIHYFKILEEEDKKTEQYGFVVVEGGISSIGSYKNGMK
jgi:hypothetical protein